jgi:hypothetical protein
MRVTMPNESPAITRIVKKLCRLLICNLLLSCLTVAVVILLCLDSDRAFGSGFDNDPKSIMSTPQENVELITSGVYGPFSPYYFPTLGVRDEVCNLVTSDFTVICFPTKTIIGTLLAETYKTETVQAQLFAVNNGLNDRPMPELIIIFPLADMGQKFFAKDVIKRLLRVGSIFDEACKFTYQVDAQPQRSEEWFCSSFLKYFDKHTGQSRLYYELRIRPVALRPVSDENAIVDTNQNSFKFFKNIKSGKALNFKVDLLNGELGADSILDLTGHDRWINRLLDVYYIDAPTIDTSSLDELASQVSDFYSTGDKPESQDTAGKLQTSEKVYGPFDPMACRVNRYIKYMNTQWLYPDMFLVDCNHLRAYEKKSPAWAIQIMVPKVFENLSIPVYLKKHAVEVKFRLQGFENPGFVMISDVLYDLMPITLLTYKLSKMPPDFFYSPVLQEALHSAGQIKTPCIVSYIADGKELSREQFKCDLSYQVAYDDINVTINVDYDFKKCFQLENKSCQKDVLMKAVSFLKEIKDKPQELAIKIEFEAGGAITANLDLSDFELAAMAILLERIDLLH